MTEKAILDISHGDSPGFNIALEIEGKRRCTGKLPPVEEIHQLYEQWRDCYIGLEKALRGKPISSQAGNSQDLVEKCKGSAENFLTQFNSWLRRSEDLEKLKIELGNEKPARLILRISEIQWGNTLKKLPWHKWDLLNNSIFDNTEIALSGPEYQNKSPPSDVERMRILAILGNSEGIDVEADRKSLEDYSETVFLTEPKRADISDHLWEQQWTILFFSGHSSSQGETGKIFINKHDSLTINELQDGLRKAIGNGLQLAIFNSCDGLKLAEDLAHLNIPQTIVMREPVPDKVAQTFLKYFLKNFVEEGNTLYLSVKAARMRLNEREEWDEKIPGCTWLPVIWQNPSVEPIRTKEKFNSEPTRLPQVIIQGIEGTVINTGNIHGDVVLGDKIAGNKIISKIR